MLNFKKFKYRLPDSPWRLLDSPNRGVDDSPTRRVGKLATPRLAESESCRLPDSPSRGVVFRLRISLRIRSLKRNGSKGSVRDLWGPNFFKNPRKSASLPCPFNNCIQTSLPYPGLNVFLLHPQNVRFQNVRFTKRQVYKTLGVQNVRFTKCEGLKRLVSKTFGFKTSSF